jgi:hypothetical protein
VVPYQDIPKDQDYASTVSGAPKWAMLKYVLNHQPSFFTLFKVQTWITYVICSIENRWGLIEGDQYSQLYLDKLQLSSALKVNFIPSTDIQGCLMPGELSGLIWIHVIHGFSSPLC